MAVTEADRGSTTVTTGRAAKALTPGRAAQELGLKRGEFELAVQLGHIRVTVDAGARGAGSHRRRPTGSGRRKGFRALCGSG